MKIKINLNDVLNKLTYWKTMHIDSATIIAREIKFFWLLHNFVDTRMNAFKALTSVLPSIYILLNSNVYCQCHHQF